MIEVHIVRDKEGFIWEFSVHGHAGFAKHGKDIVCAAVSAVAYTAVGALQELAGIDNYSEHDGFMKCSIPVNTGKENRYKAGIILETMAIGFKQISDSYSKYVTVLDEEV